MVTARRVFGDGSLGMAPRALALAFLIFNCGVGAVPQTQHTSPSTHPLSRSGHDDARAGQKEKLPEGFRYGRLPGRELPVFETMSADYRDDAGTRLRQAGLLVGSYRPWPPDGGAAAAGCPPAPGSSCSFDIQCDDHDPCTADSCDIGVGDPLGSGTCLHTPLSDGAVGGCSDGLCCNGLETCQDGQCEAPGEGTGSFDQEGCQFPCGSFSCAGGANAGQKCASAADCRVCVGGTNNDDPCGGPGDCPGGACPPGGSCSGPALVCNEDSNLCRLGCTGLGICSITGGPCNSTSQCVPPDVPAAPEGNYCMNCNDGVLCNGTESCVNAGMTTGECVSGSNPCGPGAACAERDCETPGIQACTSDSDCGPAQFGPCNNIGPICFPGRCCDPASPPEGGCSKRLKSQGTCTPSASPNGGNQCRTNDDCPEGSCNVSLSCDSMGRKWYSGDRGNLEFAGGISCPVLPHNDRTLCPKYSSGIAPAVDFDTAAAFLVGPLSQSPCEHFEIGDDYEFENAAGAGDTHLGLEKFRWVGGGGDRILIEFYDENENFVEDIVSPAVSSAIGVRSLQLIPPLTIPPRGYVVIRVATNHAPNGQTVVGVTDAVDEGFNTDKLWLDGGVTTTLLEECVGGASDGIWCDPEDPGDKACVGAGGVCTPRSNILAFELEGLKVPVPTGACCNDSMNVCADGVTQWLCVAPLPSGLAGNYQGNGTACPASCGIGACCTNGECAVTTFEDCDNGDPLRWQGYGTDCAPNCCVQPVFTGADTCTAATVSDIPVPAPGDDPVVKTITGSNATASGPDSCMQGAWNAAGGSYLTVDPGWWEAFHIDDCAFVRVDYCCSEPDLEPQWALLWKGCPCNEPVYAQMDPNAPNEPATKYGSPYCQDENLWSKFGPLPADTYYVPVYSVPPGAYGQYQMHITVASCPTAACCNGDTCVETDQLGCAAIVGANFLAPPFRTIATTQCNDDGPGGEPETCATGSCCHTSDGSHCEDIENGQLMTSALCAGISGDYKGGIRCRECVCAGGDPPQSCNDDSDCGDDGPCNSPGGGACSSEDWDEPPPCPVCDFESVSHCQRQPGYDGARLADLCVEACISEPPQSEFAAPVSRVADDFVAAEGGSITSVCMWGIFTVVNLGPGEEPWGLCEWDPPEKFSVTIYDDANGIPGSIVGTRATTVVRKAQSYQSGFRKIFQWQLVLAGGGIPVQAGRTYWIEILNNTDESSDDPRCDWFWALSDDAAGPDSGNQMVMLAYAISYTFDDADFGYDMAWCINLDNTVPEIRQAACCTCGGGVGSCTVMTLENCLHADGTWLADKRDCLDVVCPNQADAGDTCATDRIVVATESSTPFNNFCTNTDGPLLGGNNDCGGFTPADALQNDIWFAWTADADCDVVFETCDADHPFITLMAIYTDNTGACSCPSSPANEVACSDNGCGLFVGGSRITLSAVSGVCYTIRIGGYQGIKSEGVLHVTGCIVEPFVPVTPTADPGPLKTRFVSFSISGGGSNETAVRIVLSSLHIVVPAYTGGPTVPFSAFDGQFVYVGPPATYVESSSSQTPFTASFTTCTPHYRDWNSVGLLHVTGPQIVPSSIYKVENVAASCMGVESSTNCQSGGNMVSSQLEVRTTRWGDVRTPYNPPDPSVQPDISDVSALVDKFRNALGAPIKARALQVGIPGNPWGQIDPAVMSVDFGFGHISACVDAYRGTPYPFKMGKCAGAPIPPATGACTATSECTGNNGAAPCNLYCP